METRELILLERNVFITISILLLLIYALVRNVFPKVFEANFAFSKLVSFRVREEIGGSLKPFSRGQLFFSAVYALTFSYIILFLARENLNSESSIYFLSSFNSIWAGLLLWLLLSIIVYVSVYLKLGFLFLLGMLFNLGSGYQRQFSDLFSVSGVFFLLISTLLSVTLYSQIISVEQLSALLVKCVILFLAYRTVLIYLKLAQTTEYSKLYIFSYICTTEMIPLFIGLKLLV